MNTNGQLHFKDSDIRNQSVAYFENGELKSAPYVFIESDGTIVATGLAGIELKGDIRGNGTLHILLNNFLKMYGIHVKKYTVYKLQVMI